MKRALWAGWPVWAVALGLVVCGELAARAFGPREAGWDAWSRVFATKLATLEQRYARGEGPQLLVVGDSTAAFNIMPGALEEATGLRAFNLGTPGNFPRSFDVVMRQGVLPALPVQPDVLVVSFSSFSLQPDVVGQAPVILASPIARRARGSFVWADHIALVRLHERLRLLREPPPHKTVARMAGYEPYPDALTRRRRQPRLAQQLPAPPAWLGTAPPPVPLEGDPLGPVRALIDDAERADIRVVLVSPPEDLPWRTSAIASLAAERGVPHLPYAELPIPHQDGHMDYRGALAYSLRMGKDLRALLGGD